MDFIILSVNGVDVSQCSHEEAVQRFLEAKEPILVEVKRRSGENCFSDIKDSCKDSIGCKEHLQEELSGVQEEDDEDEDVYSSGRESEEGALIYPDFEYEEIVLKRPNPMERLGMTLCYEDEDAEGNTEIFIDDIDPDGLAARDGRLRLGDQIVQIQGVKVKNKAKAQEMFLTINGDISLLVVRPPVLSGGYEEDLDNLLDLSEEVTTRGRDQERLRDVSKNRLSSTSSKDSGNNSGTIDRSTTASSNSASSKNSVEEESRKRRTDEDDMKKRRNDEEELRSKRSEEEVALGRSPIHDDHLYSTDSEFYYVDGKLEQISDFYKEFKHKGLVRDNLSSGSIINYIDPIYEMIPEASETEDQYCLPLDSRVQDSRQFQLRPKQSKSQERLKSLCRSISSPIRMNEYLMNKVKRSTSNQNNVENTIPASSTNPIDVHSWLKDTKIEGATKHSHTEPSLRLGNSQRTGSTLSLVVPKGGKVNNGGIVYTNLDNLERTIRLQQERLLREREEERLRPRFAAPPPPSHPPPDDHEQVTSFRGEGKRQEGTWEWKIKIRPDGSRYIARRPVRSKLLRERGRRIEEERKEEGSTTEDDVRSERKVGRFWTKEERKKQFEVSKERRKRQEEIIRSKTVSLRQGGGGGSVGPKRMSFQEEVGGSEPVLVATV